MASEIHLAFAHPSERSAATDDGMPLDRISVRDYAVDVEIGAFQAERGKTQRIKFNIVVEVQPLTGPIDDDVDRILSYDKVTEAIAHELADERLNLLETLAERVADRILIEPQAVRAFVRIEKMDRGPGALGVEIVRARTEDAAPAEEDDPLHPELVFFGNAAIASSHLTGWIDALAAKDAPLIICVAASDLAVPQTELDWAMKNGQSCVWAPSKIVLDAVAGPSVQPSDAVALAAWFASTYHASELLVIGADLPADASVPLRAVPVTEAVL